MILKIVLVKTDYTSSQRGAIINLAHKADVFVDSGERNSYEFQFAGRQAMSKLAQVRRSIGKISTPSWLVKNAPMREYLN